MAVTEHDACHAMTVLIKPDLRGVLLASTAGHRLQRRHHQILTAPLRTQPAAVVQPCAWQLPAPAWPPSPLLPSPAARPAAAELGAAAPAETGVHAALSVLCTAVRCAI